MSSDPIEVLREAVTALKTMHGPFDHDYVKDEMCCDRCRLLVRAESALASLSAPKPPSMNDNAVAVNESAPVNDKPESAMAAGEVLRSEDGVARVAMFDDSLRPGTKVYTAPPRPEASKWERIIGKWQERVAAAGFNGVEEAIEAIEASIAPQQASAPVGVEAIIEAFDEITGLCRHLRQGGPAPEDLHDLSVALDEAIGIAGNMLAALTQQPAACDMGELCIGCEPRNPDGSCPDQQPAAVDEAVAGWSLRHERGMIRVIGPDGRSYAAVDPSLAGKQQGGES